MWRPENWENPYPIDHFTQTGKVYYETDSGRNAIFEAGADAMLGALYKLAEESPTKTFTIDSRVINIYEVK